MEIRLIKFSVLLIYMKIVNSSKKENQDTDIAKEILTQNVLVRLFTPTLMMQ